MRTFSTGHRLGRIYALALFVSGLAPIACGHPPAHRGAVDFIATLPSDVTVAALTYQLTGEGFGGLAGGIHVSEPQQQFEKLINSIPVGEDDELAIGATSADGKLTCKGSTRLTVRQGLVTRVHVPLTCSSGDGNVLINVNVVSMGSACPGVQLVDYMVSPLTASIGDAIACTANTRVSDPGALTYAWSAPSGRFADPTSAHTIYRCDTAGFVMLSLRVTESGCSENETVVVDCVGTKDASGD
jgi:hypothetical protein